jgi:DNA-binding NarL/FixJ family response regulator
LGQKDCSEMMVSGRSETKKPSHKYWTTEEERALLDSTKTNKQIAHELGRTETAVRVKRSALERRKRVGYHKGSQ